MRIVFLLPVADMSGGNRVVSIYAKALGDLGHVVTVISSPRRPLSIGRKIRTFIRHGVWSKAAVSLNSHLDNLGLNHRILEMPRPIESSDVPDADVLIATWWETAEWLSRIDRKKGAKAYFIQHHEVFEYLPIERIKATYKLPMHKIVIANWLRDVMKIEYGDTKVDLVLNSVDQYQFSAPVRAKQIRPTVGFLFSKAEFKGLDITLAAIQKLREHFPNLRAVSFGTAVPDGFPNWDSSIEFELSPAQYRLREIYAQCDVWITASRSEGFNLPAMEAMACRTPVVATRTGWPEDAIRDNHNGYLVDINDAMAIADRSTSILSMDDDAWQAMSLAAHTTATAGSWEQSTRQFEEALSTCIRRTVNQEI